MSDLVARLRAHPASWGQVCHEAADALEVAENRANIAEMNAEEAAEEAVEQYNRLLDRCLAAEQLVREFVYPDQRRLALVPHAVDFLNKRQNPDSGGHE